MVRKAYHVKAGHGGTLDPMAQGVLLIFMEKALKVLPYIPVGYLDKTYLMRVTLGKTTDTYDATGTTVAEFAGNINYSAEEILAALRHFVGTYDQTPPAFSAIKVNGKRAYSLARAGNPPELSARSVHVTSIRFVKDYTSRSLRHLVLRVHCSRGTYVRSLAHDLGKKLGCGAHLSYLLRERVGTWSHRDSFPAWKIESRHPFIDTKSFMPFEEILPFSKLTVSEEAQKKIKSGNPLEQRDIRSIQASSGIDKLKDIFQVFSSTGELLALYGPPEDRESKSGAKLVPIRVLL